MDREEMQKRLYAIEEEAKAIRAALEKKEQWNPKGGDWLVGLRGKVSNERGECWATDWTKYGVMYPTEEEATKAAEAFRKYHRLYAFVAEHAPDWKPDWSSNQEKCSIHYSHKSNCWEYSISCYLEESQIYMPEFVAKDLVEKLNSGEVVL